MNIYSIKYVLRFYAPCTKNSCRGAPIMRITLLFIAISLTEIIGCFLPYVWLRKGGAAWLLLPATASLVQFVWLLNLHPIASDRVYATYGGVYVTTTLIRLRVVVE